MTQLKSYIILFILLIIYASPSEGQVWSKEKANDWYAKHGWLVGSNYSPKTAINQLEMWQKEAFDTTTIAKELKWAADLGFNSMRVFLHDIVYQQDKEGFFERMETFLKIADRNGIGIMFVLFDGVWDPFPKAGPQRLPRPHVHNSGWVQSPGAELLRDTANHVVLKPYIQEVIERFKDDPRVHVWDIFNEPDNPVPQYSDKELRDKKELAVLLMKKAFTWAREINPSQPLTAGVWHLEWQDSSKMDPMNKWMLENSDVISFHSYDDREETMKKINSLKRYGRPILCTEYMARPRGSTFQAILPILKANNVAAYNWGFVAGKTNTIYPWDSWSVKYNKEPNPWFHDVLRGDGKPYSQQEVELIKRLTGKGSALKQVKKEGKPKEKEIAK